MAKAEFLIALLVAVAFLARLASATRIPYPVLLVVAGLILAVIPGIPDVEMDPNQVFIIFLPPLLFHAAFMTSPREMHREWRAIGLLAIGLVLVTLVAVAVVAHEFAHLSWTESFVLGAIVGPTDPVAATSLFRRLGLPERLITILEGESLTNDGTSLVAFRVAVGAATAGTFSLVGAVGEFFGAALGGIAVGLIAGWVITHIRRRIDDPPVEITLSLFTPYFAYIPAEHIGASGVLAAVSVGLYLASQSPTGVFSATSRLQAAAFWDVLVFLLNSLLFILVGLQLRTVLDQLGGLSLETVIVAAAAVTATVIAVRMLWMLVVPTLLYTITPDRLLNPERTALPERLLLGWSGMRGALSLAAALSVPRDVDGRPIILLITFVVILATLVGQGLTLPAVVHKLVPEQEEGDDEAELAARAATARAALDLLDEIADDDNQLSRDAIRYARRPYELRLRHLDADHDQHTLPTARDLQRRLLERERETIERMYQNGDLDQATARRMERELDLEEERWGELEESSLS